ncbi:hypothetical protein KI688_007021 [Linnemannia hyalina]|uniref:Crinkler effector protein N-terminal domain-containing protein n=1 Tax=Linnemannia hyalina TaxID=64524 RepID=A0A9P8BN51_9FUNG|nr:hypothetical protein KI688_007021 [Linnemannia hyalina]
MSNNLLKLFCLVDGEATTNAFPVEIESTKTIGDLKNFIKDKNAVEFTDVDANSLTLWRVSIPDADDDETPVLLDGLTRKKKLRVTNELSMVFDAAYPEDTIHVIVQRPPPDPQYLPQKKRIRIEEGWKPFTASDGIRVDLPPSWIDILASTEFVPEPRAAFAHLKGNVQAGDAIIMPNMGQDPKDFGCYGQGRRLFVTEQMLELWDDMHRDQERTYRRVLSGPMGVGKSYLSYFLAARAYVEGWLVLYISDAAVLDKNKQDESALQVVKRFLALNKDILTGAELAMLLNDYDGTRNISRNAMSVIFGTLLMSRDRKTLLLVDEHGKLFQRKPYVPDKFKSLVPLKSYHWWGEDAKGSRVVFTGTAHAKYEMEILEMSYRFTSVVFVGPLSRHVFSKLLDTHRRLAAPAIRDEVTAITNCVARELVYLSAAVKDRPEPISLDDLHKWTKDRTKDFLAIVTVYYKSLDAYSKEQFYKALQQTFLGSTSTIDFEWDFLDLGLIYRGKDVTQIGTQHHILCRPAQWALLELFKTLPLAANTRSRICDGSLSGADFETALCHQLICTTKPIVLNATDLNGKNSTTITLDFSHCDTLQTDKGSTSLGSGHKKALTRGYERYPRFDFMLGLLFIQASISDFESHNAGSADISKAFNVRDANNKNQIERYLNDLYGSDHHAEIVDNRFVITRNGVRVPEFRIVYIRGSLGKPSHRGLVKKYPDVRHISFEEVREKLFKNIGTSSL